MARLTAITWSVSVRRSPPSCRSGAPKSTTHGSTSLASRALTALPSGEMSYTSALIIRGGTRTMAGRVAPRFDGAPA